MAGNPEPTQDRAHYYSYLLRVWRTGHRPVWRASLEEPQSGRRRGFASLEALYLYLQSQTGDVAADEEAKTFEGGADR